MPTNKMHDITPMSRGRMVRYNHSKIITHRTCLTYAITTVDVHHIISSIVQSVDHTPMIQTLVRRV